MNTSATGGFLQPEPGPARSEIERLLGDVIAGITGLSRDLVRERVAVPPADPESGATWCSFGIARRSESKSQVRHYETEDGRGMSRVLTHETLTVPVSFFGPGCEDAALKLKAGLQVSQNREPLWHANIALVRAGDVVTPPASPDSPDFPDSGWTRWSARADLALTFGRGPASPQGKAAEGTVAITHAEQPDCGVRGN